MATGCYLPRTTVCPDLNMARPPAEICRLIETSLRHLHIFAYGHIVMEFGQMFLQPLHYGVGGFHFFVWLNPAYLCGYSFAKVLSVLPNGKPGTANPPQTSWVYLLFLHLPYCILCRQAQRRHVLYGQESREDGNECSQPLRLKEQLAPLVVKYCFSL